MEQSLKNLLIKNSKFTGSIVGIVTIILIKTFGLKIASIYVLGAILGILTSLTNGVIMEKYLMSKPLIINIGYVLRILLIIVIAIPFSKELITFLAYLGGFITHHICLIFYWIFIRKGSD